MKFYWPDYHRLAKELFNSPDFLAANYEATIRTVISRSYYAAFKVVFNYIRDIEKVSPPRGDNEHWFTINFMKRTNNSLKKDIGDSLDRLRNLRNLADYQDELFDQFNRANYCLILAENIFENIRQITK